MEEKVIRCPIYMEDHTYGGHLARIENFTNINFGKMRTTIINGYPYFCCVDICNILGLNSDKYTYDIKERFKNNPSPDTTRGWYRENYFYIPTEVITGKKKNGAPAVRITNMMYVSEPVLYMIIFQSRKSEALEFQWWVYEEVLPTISYLGRDNAIRALHLEIDRLKAENSQLKFNNHVSEGLLHKVSSEFKNKCIDNSLMKKDIAIRDAHINDMHNFNNHLLGEIGTLSTSATNITEIQKTLFDIIRCLEGFAQVADRKM